MRKLGLPFIAASFLLLVTAVSSAQDFPSRPISIVVPYAPGGSTDILGRVLGEAMGRALKQPVIVENAGGAGGTVGAARVAKAVSNGYTLLFHNMGHAAAPALYPSLSFNPESSFEPIGLVADVPMLLVGRKGIPASDLAGLIAYAKANPNKLNFAHSGAGSTAQLCSMLLATTAGVTFTSVPYRGTGPALQDMIGGQVDLLCDQPVSTTSFLQSGQLVGYAIANKTRLVTLPNVPTFTQAGMPGFELAVWHGLYAPKGTPQPVLDILVKALQQALKDPNLEQRFASLGTAPVELSRATPQALRVHLHSEVARWGPMIKKAGVQAD